MQIDKKKLLLKDLPSIRQMLAFIAVYEFGHMSAAAEDLALTQPAVTVLIKELENKLGVKLFDRATRTLKPTAAAEQVLPFILRALNELDDLNRVMQDYTALHAGSLTLAVTPYSSQNVLPKLLSSFQEQHPQIRIHIVECEPLQLIPCLLKDKADLALGALDKQLPSLSTYTVMQDEIVAVCTDKFELPSADIYWEDLKQQPLILTKVGYGIRTSIDQVLQQKNILQDVCIAHEVSLISTVLALVKSGLGIGLVPRSAVNAADQDVKVYPLTDPIVQRNISLIHLKDKNLSPSAQAFLNQLPA
ncbi:LysR family transcriptional regulator [Acinetobacter sp. ANC 3813]|uniref:LysR family transcriptional regulator n=1 Tax=Acinetobacter sp. ANC 3813 TaxID=1977873 RepID=UPI000A3595C5|nr:LysR family transcriptional regulator [Acinetobacter sp. ANC 3813]OTG90865.1 hypothetical protein B9T34_05680 [Acinetobacter sp. ANC 3813]